MFLAANKQASQHTLAVHYQNGIAAHMLTWHLFAERFIDGGETLHGSYVELKLFGAGSLYCKKRKPASSSQREREGGGGGGGRERERERERESRLHSLSMPNIRCASREVAAHIATMQCVARALTRMALRCSLNPPRLAVCATLGLCFRGTVHRGELATCQPVPPRRTTPQRTHTVHTQHTPQRTHTVQCLTRLRSRSQRYLTRGTRAPQTTIKNSSNG